MADAGEVESKVVFLSQVSMTHRPWHNLRFYSPVVFFCKIDSPFSSEKVAKILATEPTLVP